MDKVLAEAFDAEQINAIKDLLNSGLDEVEISNALQSILGDTEITENQKKAIENYIDSLYDTSGAMDEFYTNVMEKVGGAFEDLNEKSKKAINRSEQLGKTLEAYQNIIDLVGKKSLGVTDAQIRALGRAQVAQAKNTLEIKQGQLELAEAALKSAQAQRQVAEASGDTKAIEHWDEQIEIIQDSVWELENEVESAWSDTLQVISDDFVNAIEVATSAFEEAMTGIYGSYEKMQQAFDQQKEIGDRYVANYEKIYELSKLNRDLTNSIDSTDSIKAKQSLRDLQEEINELQQSDTEMSQHDLEYLRKKYELRLAEIALEEAQNAKSQVRMRQDSEGNWSYVYTADEDKVADAMQNFEDKLFEIQELEQNYIDEMQEMVISAEVNMIEAINELRAEDFETQEAYQAEVTRITEYYTGMRNYALDELNKALDNSKYVYENDWKSYSGYQNQKLEADLNWRTQFSDTFIAQINGYADVKTARDTFESETKTMTSNLSLAFSDWEQDVKDAFTLVKQDFNNFSKPGGPLDSETKKVTDILSKISDEFGTWGEKAKSGFEGITTAASNQFNSFQTQMAKYQSEISKTTNLLTYLLELAGMKVPEVPVDTETDGTQNGGNGGNPNDVPGTDPNDNPDDGGGSGVYYGIYKTETGAQRRTKKSYSSIEEAKAGAKAEAKEYAQHLAKQDQYDYSQGLETSNGLEFASQAEIKAKGEALAVDDNISYQDEASVTVTKTASNDFNYKDVLLINTGEGEQLYLSQGGYSVAKGDEQGNYYKLTWTNGKTYRIDKNTINDIMKKFPNDIKKSPSGDPAFADPPFDKGDKVTWKEGTYGYLDPHGPHGKIVGGKSDVVLQNNPISINGTNWYKIPYDTTYGDSVWVIGHNLIPAYDTGGYTGSWDSSGRLAMLHQKEIVLNAHDTENFLAAVNIVRDIARAIDLKAIAYQYQLASLAQSSVVPNTSQTLQQEVTIHAEFPNATQRTEIEAAFDTLLNRASQFANRKN